MSGAKGNRELAARNRQMLTMWQVERQTYREIAAQFHLSVVRVYQIVSRERSRQKLEAVHVFSPLSA